MAKLTRNQMLALIAAGQTVLYKGKVNYPLGKIIFTADDVPTDEEFAQDAESDGGGGGSDGEDLGLLFPDFDSSQFEFVSNKVKIKESILGGTNVGNPPIFEIPIIETFIGNIDDDWISVGTVPVISDGGVILEPGVTTDDNYSNLTSPDVVDLTGHYIICDIDQIPDQEVSGNEATVSLIGNESSADVTIVNGNAVYSVNNNGDVLSNTVPWNPLHKKIRFLDNPVTENLEISVSVDGTTWIEVLNTPIGVWKKRVRTQFGVYNSGTNPNPGTLVISAVTTNIPTRSPIAGDVLVWDTNKEKFVPGESPDKILSGDVAVNLGVSRVAKIQGRPLLSYPPTYLKDDFNGGLNSDLWQFFDQYSQFGGRIRFSPGDAAESSSQRSGSLTSRDVFSLADVKIHVDFLSIGDPAKIEAYFTIDSEDEPSYLEMYIHNGNLQMLITEQETETYNETVSLASLSGTLTGISIEYDADTGYVQYFPYINGNRTEYNPPHNIGALQYTPANKWLKKVKMSLGARNVGGQDNVGIFEVTNLDSNIIIEDGDTISGDTLLWTKKYQRLELGTPLPVRGRAIHTTDTLANDTAEQTEVDLGVSFILQRIKTSVPARVRVYASNSHRAADASRAIGVDPTGAHGVIADIVTTGGNLDLIMSPPIVGVSFAGIPAWKELPVLIENRSGASASVIVEFTRVVLEKPDLEDEVIIETSNLAAPGGGLGGGGDNGQPT